MFDAAFQSRLEELARRSPAAGAPTALAAVASHNLGDLVPGEVAVSGGGEFYEVRARIDELWPSGGALLAQARSTHAGAPQSASVGVALGQAVERGLCLLDLETCGFAGSPIFLIGLLLPIDGQYELRQLLARNYAEERAILCALGERLGEETSLATFNGKSFDWPLLVERSHRHRLETPSPRPREHFDLLHVARRRWRRLLPDCKLQTLERFICRRTRGADVPGAQIPQEYHYFVRTGDARRLAEIVRHNQLDLLTLWELILRLVAAG